MKDEALRLALEALKTCQIDGDGWSGPHYYFDGKKVGKAIPACEQALEQPEPEPVATVYEGAIAKWNLPEKFTGFLYSSPPKREPLTDEQIEALRRSDDLFEDAPMWKLIARAIEAAHGIKGEA